MAKGWGDHEAVLLEAARLTDLCDNFRAALAARDAEVARLREALENVTYVHYPDGTKECRWCGDGNGEHKACEIVRYLADPTATSDRGRE